MKMRDFIQPETALVAAVSEDGITRSTDNIRMFTRGSATALLIILVLLAGCNSNTANTPPAKPEPKPPELLTGRAAFYKTFIAARNYAADVKPFRIESTPSNESNGQDGKSTIWRSSYASASQHGVKPFFWSGSNAPMLPLAAFRPATRTFTTPAMRLPRFLIRLF